MTGSPSVRPRRALVLGRFQPPHAGHLHLLRAAAGEADELIVVVGSAQASHTARDPLTASERLEVLRALVDAEALPAPWIVPVDDIGVYPLWVPHVVMRVPRFDVVVTGSPVTAQLFEEAGHPVVRVPPVARDVNRATTIRAALVRGEARPPGLPDLVADYLAEPGLRQRLARIREAQDGRSG